MFNLDKAVAEWRRKLRSAGVHRAAQLDELENHLRDDIENRVREGAGVENAFKEAINALGAPATIVGEFAKLRGRNLHSLTLILRLGCFITVPLMFLTGIWVGAEVVTVRGIAALATLCTAATYIAALPFIYRKLPAPERPWLSVMFKVMTPVFGVLPLVALLDAMRVIHLQASNTTVLLFSCLYVAYAFTILAYACREQDLRRTGKSGIGTGDIPLQPNMNTALEAAREEAERLGHHFIGTEHLLLGILRNQTLLLHKVFQCRGVDTRALAAFVGNIVPPSIADKAVHRPYTPRAVSALDFATTEAAEMNHEVIGVEHLLLGLLREGTGVGGSVLRKHGLRLRELRREIREGWDQDDGTAGVVVAT